MRSTAYRVNWGLAPICYNELDGWGRYRVLRIEPELESVHFALVDLSILTYLSER